MNDSLTIPALAAGFQMTAEPFLTSNDKEN